MFLKKVCTGLVVLIAFLCVQCSNQPSETVQEVPTAAKDAIQVAKETTTKTIGEAKEMASEVADKGQATLTSIKDKATEKVADVESKVKEEVKEVTKKVEAAPKKEAKPKPKKKKKSKPKKRAKINFEETVHKYGFIKQGDIVKHDFKFTNTGNAPLVIKNVDASCGCTFPSYPFIPIEPGKEGVIGVTFDSKGKIGPQKPTITVVTNGRPRTLKLNLDGYVE